MSKEQADTNTEAESKEPTAEELAAAQAMIDAAEEKRMKEELAKAEEHLIPLRKVIDTEAFDVINKGVKELLKEYSGNPQIAAHLNATTVGLQGLARFKSPKS